MDHPKAAPEKAHDTTDVVPLRTMAGRYQLRSELGRGGMATVYRAFDLGKQREVALKVLERSDERLVALFEREFETLASLAHPRVIAVYEFGITEEGKRFYTMALLEGRDLYALSPLPWARACEYIRDVCTSLVLLHARRLLHRDVNPRNVRLDAEGRAKLIDFGALTDFGLAAEAVGTPNCVAPEVLRGRELDQRTDLFSLGAVMYYALTGRTPYSVSSFADAETAWRTAPAPPSAHVPEIPKALDELVLSLLSIDVMSRPSSAAELIDRLGALGQLDDELLSGLAASHVYSSILVGRERELAELTRVRAVRRKGSGGVVVLEGDAGAGRTRLVASACIDAQLSGLAAVRVSAHGLTGPDDLLCALHAGVLEAAPREAALKRGAYAERLRALVPAREDQPPEADRAPDREATMHNAQAKNVRLQAAVAEWIGSVARERPLLVTVDDAHVLNPSSAGVLPMLARVAQERPLFLVVTRLRNAAASPAVLQLAWMGVELSLGPLDHLACSGLVRSIFGDVPHRARLEQWLMRGTGGNPGKIAALLGRLLERKVIRYAGGAFMLPYELNDAELEDVQDAAAAKLSGLSTDARRVADLLALQASPMSERLLSCVRGQLGGAPLRAALEELVRAGLASEEEGGYRLASASIREQLEGGLELGVRRELHRCVAETMREHYLRELEAVLEDRTRDVSTSALVDITRSGLHFLRAGEEALGTRVLRRCAVELTKRGEGLMAVAPELEAAIQTYRALGRPRNVYAALMTVLTLAGTYSDFRLSYAYGDELLDVLAETAGFKWAASLDRWLPGRLALGISLALACVLFYLIPSRRIVASFRDVMLGLVGIGTAVLGMCPVMQDSQRARRVAERLRMLGQFPVGSPAREVHGFQLALVDHAFGRYRESAERCRRFLLYLGSESAKGALREDARLQLEAGVYILLSQLDALRVDHVARETLETVKVLNTSTSRQTRAAAHVVYHGHRGERPGFLRHLDEMDRLAAESGATWRNDVQVPRMMWSTYVLCEDILSLKRAVQQLERLAQEVPSVALMRDVVNACYLGERGLHDEALARYTPIFEASYEALQGLRGLQYRTAYARLLRKAGKLERAREICDQELSRLTPADFEYAVLTFALERELVLTLMCAEDLERARERADSLLEAQSRHDNLLLVGLAHGARAEVALAMGDAACFEQHLQCMRQAFKPTDNPALLTQAQKLLDRGRGFWARRPETTSADAEATVLDPDLRVSTDQPQDSLPVTLVSAVLFTRAQGGYLFAVERGSLRLVERTLEVPSRAALEELERTVLSGDAFETELIEAEASAEEAAAPQKKAAAAPLERAWLGYQAYWLPVRGSAGQGEPPVGVLVLLAGTEGSLRSLTWGALSELTSVCRSRRAPLAG